MTGILFDARVIGPGMTGIGNYARNLLRVMPASTTRMGIILPAGSPYAAEFPEFRIHFSRSSLTSHPRTEFFEQFFLPAFCRLHGYSHLVSFEGRVPFFHPGVHTFAFIYDLAFIKVPGSHNLKYSLLLRLSQWIAKKSSSRIVTISNTVRDEIAATFRVPHDKILVAYPSDSGLHEHSTTAIRGVRSPYVFTVGMTNRRKNLGNLLKAMALLRSANPELRLVITGNKRQIDEVLREERDADSLNLGFVEPGELRNLYETAEAMIYPSLDEGFGIPLVDAARFGCPVLCSDIPVFHEVLGDSATYFDPRSPHDIARALATVGRRSPAAPGSSGERFSWAGSARALVAEIQGVR